MEPWIETVNGNKFWFTGDSIDGIEIDDIAHALSNLCRFTGHCKEFYSVAEHSVHVAYLLPPEKFMWGLLHDASEAYLADIASPVKQLLPEYKVLEEKIMDRVARRFNLPEKFWHDPDVKRADWMQLRSESRELLPSKGKDWYFPKDIGFGFTPLNRTSARAFTHFMAAFNDREKEAQAA